MKVAIHVTKHRKHLESKTVGSHLVDCLTCLHKRSQLVLAQLDIRITLASTDRTGIFLPRYQRTLMRHVLDLAGD